MLTLRPNVISAENSIKVERDVATLYEEGEVEITTLELRSHIISL
jgi:hypothetical protein